MTRPDAALETGAAPETGAPLETGASVPLLYHELRALPDAYTYAMPMMQFAEHLAVLNVPGSWPAALTFDDGHRSDYELALPALLSAGQTATFFITAGWTGRRAGYMDAVAVRALHAQGMRIGAHGWHHRLLTQCTPAELRVELNDARALLEDTLGAPVTEMSLPGGRSNRDVLRAATEAGYTRVWTSQPGVATADMHVVPRLNVRSSVSAAALGALLDPRSGALLRARRIQRLKTLGQELLGDRAYAALWRLVNRADPNGPDPGPDPDQGSPDQGSADPAARTGVQP